MATPGSRNRIGGLTQMRAFLRRNQAQAMPEYTVVLAVVSSGSAFLLSQLGGRVTEVLMQVAGYLP